MFGYVTVNQEDLKIREFGRYRSFYCGLCHMLHSRYGRRGQALLTYDMTFLNLLLESLYEEPLTEEERRCLAHPGRRHHMVYNEITEYTADMTVLLSYYKMLDDWKDERKIAGGAGAKAFAKDITEIAAKYPRQETAVRECVGRLAEYEEEDESDLDRVAGLTGHMTAEVFAYRADEWTDELSSVGFYLGKYIYLLDAYLDLEKDLKKGRYNVWSHYCGRKDFDALAENTLTMMMSECARYFERLPLVQDVEILRNIVYSGVWMRFNRRKAGENKGDAT